MNTNFFGKSSYYISTFPQSGQNKFGNKLEREHAYSVIVFPEFKGSAGLTSLFLLAKRSWLVITMKERRVSLIRTVLHFQSELGQSCKCSLETEYEPLGRKT